MSYEIPDVEPKKIFIKATLKWTKDLSDYPASTWTLKYYFVHTTAANNFSITASADGDTHSVSVPTTTTDDYVAGTYRWYAQVTDGTDTITLDWLTGEVVILADVTAAATVRTLTHAQTALAAIKSMLEGTATTDTQSYSIGGRSLSRYSIRELLELKSYYEAEVAKEERQEAIERGEAPNNRILTTLKTGA